MSELKVTKRMVKGLIISVATDLPLILIFLVIYTDFVLDQSGRSVTIHYTEFSVSLDHISISWLNQDMCLKKILRGHRKSQIC